jgi:hypothetical protein
MKLLSIANSKAIWLFSTLDLNPKGASMEGLMAAVQERYQFKVIPTIAQLVEFATNKTALRFAMGDFQLGDEKFGIALTYYADGLMVETRAGTTIADDCLADLLQWATNTYSTTDYKALKIRKIYASEVHVSFDQSLGMINPKLANFGAAMARKARWPQPTPHFEITSVAFGGDPGSKSQHPPFRIERDASAAFEDQRYYSAAPLQTSDHLEMLKQFEDALIW